MSFSQKISDKSRNFQNFIMLLNVIVIRNDKYRHCGYLEVIVDSIKDKKKETNLFEKKKI